MRTIILSLTCAFTLTAAPIPRAQDDRITTRNLDKLRPLETLEREAYRIHVRPDGQRIAFVRWEKPVEILGSNLVGPFGKVGNDNTIGFAFSRDPNVVAYSTNGNGSFIVDLKTKKEIQLDVEKDQASLAFSPDVKQLVTGGYFSGVKVWDVKTGKLIRKLNVGTTEGALTPVLSPDGKVLAVGNRNSTARLFDAATGNLLHVLDEKMSQGLAFHPNGKTLAIVYVDGSLVLWDVKTGNRLQKVKSDAKELYSVCWSHDGKLLVTAGRLGSVTIWDPDKLMPLKKFSGMKWVISVSFTPDGKQLLAGGGNGLSGGWRKVWRWGIR